MANRFFKPVPDLLIAALVLVTLWRLIGHKFDIFAVTVMEVPKLLEPGNVVPLTTSAARQASQRDIVLFALTTCGACTTSIPFYQWLGHYVGSYHEQFRLVVVSTEATETVRGWLSANAIRVDEIVQIPNFEDLGIVVTPTLAISSPLRRVTDVHMGVLSEERIHALFGRLPAVSAATPLNNVPRELASQECDRLAADEQVSVIDVRERPEYAAAHSPAAMNIPFVELSVRGPVEVPFLNTVMIDKEVPLDRRRAAGLFLADLGYSKIVLCGELTRRVRRR